MRGWVAAALLLLVAAATLLLRRGHDDEHVHAGAHAPRGNVVIRRGSTGAYAGRADALLVGTVVSGGAPLASATVCASCADCDPGALESAPRCVRTGDDGRYALDAPGMDALLLSATAEQHAPGLANGGKPITPAAGDHEYDIHLARGGARVTGTVVDTTGGPVVEASVHALFKTDTALGGPVVMHPVTTDAQGAFSLWTSAGHVSLTASAPGYAPGYASRTAPTHGLELLLTPESRIQGKVVTERGSPVEDALVTASMPMSEPRRGRTDAAGEFVIAGLQPGVYELRASGEHWMGELPSTVTLDLADVLDGVVLTVRPAAIVQGKLRVGDQPCSQGQVTLGPRGNDGSVPLLNAASTQHGEVVFEAVPPGTYQVALVCPGYETQQAAPLEVEDEDLSGVAWRMEPGRTISGSVRDRVGGPLAKLQLHLRDPRDPDGYTSYALTDAAGRFAFRGVRPGAYLVENAELERPADVDVRHGDATDLSIVASAVGRLTVRVVTARGEAVDGVSVDATAADGRSPLPPEELGNGTYVYAALAAGTYAVRVHDGVNPPVQAGGPQAMVEIAAGRTKQLEVRLARSAQRITGHVRDDQGAPVANVWVRAMPQASSDLGAQLQAFRLLSEGRRSLSDDDGAFTIEGLAEGGRFVVVAERPLGGQVKQEDVAAGARIELRLEPLGSIAGTALGPDGMPVTSFGLTLQNERTGQQRHQLVHHPDGHFRIDDVTPGPVQLSALDRQGNLAIVTQPLLPKQRLEAVRLSLSATPPEPAPDVLLGAGAPDAVER